MTAPLDLEALAATVARMTDNWYVGRAFDGYFYIDDSDDTIAESLNKDDAAGIVALKNAAPALIAETQALRERVRVLEEAFSNVQTLVTEAVDLERIGCVTALDAISDIARAALSGE